MNWVGIRRLSMSSLHGGGKIVGKYQMSMKNSCKRSIVSMAQPNIKKYTHENCYNIIPQPKNTATSEQANEFDSLYANIIQDITDPYKKVPEVYQHYKNLLESNLPQHKQASGLAVVPSYIAFESSQNATPQNIHLANILGWCVDLVLCSWQINDDFMDGSETRRGLPCWYKQVGVGAINDAVYLTNAPFILLEKYFTGNPFRLNATRWFQEIILKTTAGQTLDSRCQENGKTRLHAFNKERFLALSRYKGTYPELSFPVILGMKFANRNEKELNKEISSILFEIGDYFEAQNDILDVYGDPKISGKEGSDIKDGKCTWLVVTALEKADKQQKRILEEHYGRSDPESIHKVKVLFEELAIYESFLDYETKSYGDFCKRIEQLKELPVQEFFMKLLRTMYGLE